MRLRTAVMSSVIVLTLAACSNPASPAPGPVVGGAATKVGPDGDAFYLPPDVLPAGTHGRLIWARPFQGPALLSGATNTLLLYTQQVIEGTTVATSGFVAVPRGTPPPGGWPVVTWGHGTTGIADQCAPTRYDNPKNAATNVPLLKAWVNQGYAVVASDYEGLGTPGDHPYLDGPSEGRSMLDAVRAARQLNPDLSDRVLVAGHSQGGQAALWAASLAPTYTSDLHLGGTIAFAPESQARTVPDLIKTVSFTRTGGTVALILRGAQIADPALDVQALLTPTARALWPQTLTDCAADLNTTGSFGGLPLDQILRADADTAALTQELTANDPTHLGISGPILLEQGLADTTVNPQNTTQLDAALGAAGDTVTEHTYLDATHATVISAATQDATTFLTQQLPR